MTAYHGNMVEVVDEEDGAQLLGLEGARQLHQQVHACIPHAVQIVVQLPILHPTNPCCAERKRKEKTTPFGVNLTRSQVLYRCAHCSVVVLSRSNC